MRKIISLILLVLIPVIVSGKLFSISDYHSNNSLAINPACAGSKEALCATVFYRTYQTGFEGSPETMTLAIHTPLKQERIGLGFLIMRDVIGITSETSFTGSYAYRMNLGVGKLAMGIGFGFMISNTSWNKLAALDPDDDLLFENYSSGILPDFSSGIYYSTRKFFLGFSVPLFINYEFNAKTEKYIPESDLTENNYFLNTGYTFDLHPDFKMLPSIMLRYHKASVAQIDIGTHILLKNKVWIGTIYRSKYVLAGVAQYQVNNQLKVAYSYDFIIGERSEYNFNSHEIMLNYIFNYKTKVSGPRHF